MHPIISLTVFASIALSAPAPQSINLDAINAYPDPVLFTPPVDVTKNLPAPAPSSPLTPIATPETKRDTLHPRDGTCPPQPSGSGPTPNPDTASAFTSDPGFAATATNAPTPDGYTLVFTSLSASLSAPNYMGLYTLPTYDTLTCASQCDQAAGCLAFNIYLERDPSLDPNSADCPNPPSVTNYKCTLWGVPVTAAEATNSGQWRDEFQVVIAGSNAYNKLAPPPSIPHYTGPTELGGAINAPLDSAGHDTYLGYKFFPFSQAQGYTPQTCADACDVQTSYNRAHPAGGPNGTYQSCVFFNAYVLSENAVPQGLYCSLYNETWSREYATNYGQYRGEDRYTVSESYSYALGS